MSEEKDGAGRRDAGCRCRAREPPGVDEVLRVLADVRRRRLLAALSRADDDTLALADLVADVAEDVDGSPARVRVAFRHNHLPRLEEAGLVEFDPEAGTVTYDPDPIVEAVVAAVESGAGDDSSDGDD